MNLELEVDRAKERGNYPEVDPDLAMRDFRAHIHQTMGHSYLSPEAHVHSNRQRIWVGRNSPRTACPL